MEKLLKELLALYDAETDEIEERYGDDFNAMDASGGNFDDAYELGYEHGESYGKYALIQYLLGEMNK